MDKEVHILLIEDNPGDILLTLEAFKEVRLKNTVTVLKDGEEALLYLRRQGQYRDARMPDIVLLDINLPKVDGKEVLAAIKHDDSLKTIPVVMLTTSDSEKDVMDAYCNHANCYITKPVDFGKFMEVVKALENFWITIVKLPPTTG